MTRAFYLTALLVAILLHTSLSAQINNYYNAPAQYQLPGTAAAPGVTPFLGTSTAGASTYSTGNPSVGSTPFSSGIPSTSTYGTSAYSTSGANYYPQPYTAPGYQPSTGNVSTAFSTPISTLNQIYPQPAQPQTYGPSQGANSFVPIAIPVPAYSQIAPPDTWAPGLATIREGKWAITDYLYNLTPSIGVKVQVIKPVNRYMPLSEILLEKRVIALFQDALLTPTAIAIPCEPPLPVYNVTVMAYPCDRRCVGVVTAQLYEIARPDRIDQDLSGVWQVVTWERQELVASSCEDFSQEIEKTISGMTEAFIEQYNHFNPIPERSCFPQ